MGAEGWASFATGLLAAALASVWIAWRKERMCYRLLDQARDYYRHADDLLRRAEALSRQSNGKAKQ